MRHDRKFSNVFQKPFGEKWQSPVLSDWSIQKLFADGLIGAWYDPSDLQTMFAAPLTATPITTDGETVGVILDKSQGGRPGADQITNGDFSDGSTGWTPLGGWTIAGGKASFNAASGNVLLQSGAGIVGGMWYLIEFELLDYVSGAVYTQFSGPGGTVLGYYQGNQTVRLIRQAQSAPNGGFIIGAYGGSNLSVDNVSVRPIPGNHLTQGTSAARPTYRTDGTQHWLSFNGIDDYMQTASLNLSTGKQMTVMAAVEKTNTVTTGAIAAFGISGVALPFIINSPAGGGSQDYKLSASGTTSATGNAEPNVAVVSAAADITNDVAYLRINGQVRASSSADQGTGTYGNYPLTFGAQGGAATYFQGDVYGAVFMTRMPGTVDLERAESALAQTIGVSL